MGSQVLFPLQVFKKGITYFHRKWEQDREVVQGDEG
jgi:hypothetical protein